MLRRLFRLAVVIATAAGLLTTALVTPASASDPMTFQQMIGNPRLYAPQGVATDATGSVYVAEPYLVGSITSDQVVKYSADGFFEDVIAGPGTGICGVQYCGEVDDPTAVAIAPNGDLYVAQQGGSNDRVERFDSTGVFLGAWGGAGAGTGQFSNPKGIAVNSSGYVYVADTGNSRIQEFDASGNYVRQWTSTSVAGLAIDGSDVIYAAGGGNLREYDTSGVVITSWASSGAVAVAVDGPGNVWIASNTGNTIRRYDSGGTPLLNVGSSGSGDGQLSGPLGIAVAPSGNVYVADTGNGRVQRFSGSGTYQTQWGEYPGDGVLDSPTGLAVDASGDVFVTNKTEDIIQKFDSSGNYLLKWGGTGCATGQMTDPAAIAVDGSGNVYVADTKCERIQEFDGSGNYLSDFGSFGDCLLSCLDGQVKDPAGIAVDGSGNVYVADTGNHRIQQWNSSGVFVGKWGSNGSGDAQFKSPKGIAIDQSGDVWVADSGNNRIQEFTGGGGFMGKWGTLGSGDGQFKSPTDLDFDAEGAVWVLDKGNDRVERVYPSGTTINFLSQMGSTGLKTGQFDTANGLVIDGIGRLLVADTNNDRVQVLIHQNGPDTTVLTGPASISNDTAPAFTFQANDPFPTFECKLDGGSYAACSSGDVFSVTAEASHTFFVRATDNLGKVGDQATYSWTLDTTAPDVIIDSTPAALTSSTTASFTFHSSDGGATFRCSLDGAASAPCSSGDSWPVANGGHTFDVRAIDLAGNTSAPGSYSWTVDTTPPTVTITSGPSGWVLSGNATFKFASPDVGATFQCHLDSLAFSACSSPKDYTNQPAGLHTFYVRGIDSLGNTSAAVHQAWTVDIGTHRPDEQIGIGAKFVGNNIYNGTGSKQTKTQSSGVGKSVSFNLRIENDGNESDTYAIRGPGTGNGYTVIYYSGTVDITSKITAGTYQVTLGKGLGKVLSLKVTVTKKATLSRSLLVKATSVHDPTKIDAVKAVVKRV
jgi:DNA-binding beta-propeller fold protein YncE